MFNLFGKYFLGHATSEINVNSIINCIGNTPTVELKHPLVPTGKKLFIKLEMFNLSNSVKARTALGLIKHGSDTGQLKKGGTLIETSTGNMAVSLAMLGAQLGFKVILVVDPKIPQTSLNLLKAYNAEVHCVREEEHQAGKGFMPARLQKIEELRVLHPDAYYSDQYENPANIGFHEKYTAPEIASDISSRNIPVVVGAISTGGHLCGIARGLKKADLNTKIIACDAEGSAIFKSDYVPYLLNGLGLPSRTSNTDVSVIDSVSHVTDQEAFSICRSIASQTGFLLGGSSGVAILGALSYLSQQDSDTSALVIAPDTGNNYLDTIYDDEWLKQNKIELLNNAQLIVRMQNKKLTKPELAVRDNRAKLTV